jgi:hypothetical protein
MAARTLQRVGTVGGAGFPHNAPLERIRAGVVELVEPAFDVGGQLGAARRGTAVAAMDAALRSAGHARQ